MIATWSYIASSESDEDNEVTNLCLMAIKEPKNKNLHNSFSMFHIRQQKLNHMLESQRAFFDKSGL
ncbi:hypothetical protein J1N35_022519, partial [Gossypium stocksii]